MPDIFKKPWHINLLLKRTCTLLRNLFCGNNESVGEDHYPSASSIAAFCSSMKNCVLKIPAFFIRMQSLNRNQTVILQLVIENPCAFLFFSAKIFSPNLVSARGIKLNLVKSQTYLKIPLHQGDMHYTYGMVYKVSPCALVGLSQITQAVDGYRVT